MKIFSRKTYSTEVLADFLVLMSLTFFLYWFYKKEILRILFFEILYFLKRVSQKRLAKFFEILNIRASSSQSDLRAAGSDYLFLIIFPHMADLKSLFEAHLHLGGRTSGWNPKMKNFLHSQKNGVHVFDLSQTAERLEQAKKFLTAQKLQNKKILFVGTKPQTALLLQELVANTNHYYVDQKWMPGLLTNFKEIRKRIDHYLNLKSQFETGEINKYTKKEVSQYKKELDKLEVLYHGVGEMRQKPSVVVVLDAVVNRLTVEESGVAGVPVVALVDSNANPDGVAFPIPGNDDSLDSIRFILENLVQSLA